MLMTSDPEQQLSPGDTSRNIFNIFPIFPPLLKVTGWLGLISQLRDDQLSNVSQLLSISKMSCPEKITKLWQGAFALRALSHWPGKTLQQLYLANLAASCSPVNMPCLSLHIMISLSNTGLHQKERGENTLLLSRYHNSVSYTHLTLPTILLV